MQIAYVAYKHLDASAKDKVDALLKLSADYPKWTAGERDEKTTKLYVSCMPVKMTIGKSPSWKLHTALHQTNSLIA